MTRARRQAQHLRGLGAGAQPARRWSQRRAAAARDRRDRCTNDATPDHNAAVFADRARIAGPKGDLDTLGGDIDAFLATLHAARRRSGRQPRRDRRRHRRLPRQRGRRCSSVPRASASRSRAGASPMSGGVARSPTCSARCGLLTDAWTRKLDDFDAKIAAYDALPAGHQRRRPLRRAAGRRGCSSSPLLDPLPAAPAALRTAARRQARRLRRPRATVRARPRSPTTRRSSRLLDRRRRRCCRSRAFDRAAVRPRRPFGDRAVTLRRGPRAQPRRPPRRDHDAPRTPSRRSSTRTTPRPRRRGAGRRRCRAPRKALLGDDFRIVPEFALSRGAGRRVGERGRRLDRRRAAPVPDHHREDRSPGRRMALRRRPRAADAARLGDERRAGRRARPAGAGLAAGPVPVRGDAPWLAMQFPPDYTLDSDRLLYTAHYCAPFDKTARQCGLLLDEWTEVIPGTTRDTGITFNFDRPDNEPPQAILLVTPATADRRLAMGRPRRRAQRDARPGQEARASSRRSSTPRRTRALLPATDHGGDALRHLDHARASPSPTASSASSEVEPMPSALPRRRHPRGARRERLFPSITTWNRLEARPRTPSFDRALRAEVRDALWMLTKQWQMGEFRGSDAGSPVFAKLQIDTTRLTKYRPDAQATQPFDDDVPLEAKVERRPVPLRIHGGGADRVRPAARHGPRVARADRAAIGDYRQAFIDAYPIAAPDPTAAGGRRPAARSPRCGRCSPRSPAARWTAARSTCTSSRARQPRLRRRRRHRRRRPPRDRRSRPRGSSPGSSG